MLTEAPPKGNAASTREDAHILAAEGETGARDSASYRASVR